MTLTVLIITQHIKHSTTFDILYIGLCWCVRACIGENRHTASYISEIFESVISDVGEDKIIALVTDGAANMMAAHALVREKHPKIQSIRCTSHTLNLLAKDIEKLPTLSEHINRCKEIVKVFKYQHAPAAVLRRIQKEKSITKTIMMPSPTRWGSICDVMDRLQLNRSALQTAAIDDKLSSTLVKSVRADIMNDDIFWQRNAMFVKLLKPISNAILSTEGDDALLSDVIHEFNTLKTSIESTLPTSPLTKSEEAKVTKAVSNRYKDTVTSAHKAAYLLDPRYCGTHLPEEDFHEAIDLIVQLSNKSATDTVAEIAKFQDRGGRFSSKHIWSAVETQSKTGEQQAKGKQLIKIKARMCRPSTWWGGLCKSSPLSSVAKMLLNIPPSSAAAERNFSAFSTIHTKKRNRLTTQRASKLVYVYHNSRLLKGFAANVNDESETDDSSCSASNASECASGSDIASLDEEDKDNSDEGEQGVDLNSVTAHETVD